MSQTSPMPIDDDSCDAHSHMNSFNSSSNRNSISNRVVLSLSQKKAYDKYILKTTATIRSMVIDCKTAYIIIVNKTITPGRKSTSQSSPPFASREDAEQAKNAFRYCVENNKSADSINYMRRRDACPEFLDLPNNDPCLGGAAIPYFEINQLVFPNLSDHLWDA